MLENLLLLLFALALFMRLTRSYFNRAMIWDIDEVSSTITCIVDNLISISDSGSGPTCVVACNDLGFLNDTYQIIHLRQYIVGKVNNYEKEAIFKNEFIAKHRDLIRFTLRETPEVQAAVIGMVTLQAKLCALANYPDISTEYKEELLRCIRLSPRSRSDLIECLQILHEICQRYEIDYEVYHPMSAQGILMTVAHQLSFTPEHE